jgi:hypothetical protein
VHLHKKAVRNLVAAAALVTLALPLSAPIAATTTHAQGNQLGPAVVGNSSCTSNTSLSTANTTTAAGFTNSSCYVGAGLGPTLLPVRFNPIGVPDTATFVCDALTNTLVGFGGTVAVPTVPSGCYDVTASVTDSTTGSAAAITSGTCGNQPADVNGSAINCSGVASPICPVGTAPATAFGPGSTIPCTPNCPAPFVFSGPLGAGTCVR